MWRLEIILSRLTFTETKIGCPKQPIFACGVRMYLLYADESGSVSDSKQAHFVLAGISVFERRSHWIEQALNDIAKRFDAVAPGEIELHGSPMHSGKGSWRGVSLDDRVQAIKDALEIVATTRDVNVFCCVVKKSVAIGCDPVRYTFEQLATRFDMYLARQYAKYGKAERGIIVFDKSKTEQRIQTLARDFKYNGHTWGKLKNFAEVPVFLDSRASRLIQLADMTAYAIFRFFEHGDLEYYSIIDKCFDSDGGIIHGLHTYI